MRPHGSLRCTRRLWRRLRWRWRLRTRDRVSHAKAQTRKACRAPTRFMNKLVFGALVGLIVLTPIPYGTVEPWWKAAFVCAVVAIGILALVESLITGNVEVPGRAVLLPMLALTALAFLQTLSLGTRTE